MLRCPNAEPQHDGRNDMISITAAELADLLVETGERHHQAYADTDGADPEWALWYSGYLQARLWTAPGGCRPGASWSGCFNPPSGVTAALKAGQRDTRATYWPGSTRVGRPARCFPPWLPTTSVGSPGNRWSRWTA
ncbi:hypothetical protein I547_5783 [Mycobacterium kansasii 824]|nr:hypothetical protein I547_5783 [Mycobacterium kansasii 824]